MASVVRLRMVSAPKRRRMMLVASVWAIGAIISLVIPAVAERSIFLTLTLALLAGVSSLWSG